VAIADARVAYLAKTPVINANSNQINVKTRLEVAADGSAKGTLDIDATGLAAKTVQDRLAQIPAGFGATAIQQILQSSNLRGSGFLKFPKIDRDVQKQTASAELEIKDLLREPSAGSVASHPVINLPVYILNNMGSHVPETREFSYACNSMRLAEDFVVKYDPKYQITRPPTDMQARIDGITFKSQYKFENNTLSGTRELLIDHTDQECTPQEYQRRKAIMRQIVRHLRTPMLYSQQ
jgi:hypothetical protein